MYMIFATMPDCDPEPQEIQECATRNDAIIAMREMEQGAHPDIAHWAEDADGNEVHSWDDLDDNSSGHKAICDEYWDRGLDCPCIPDDVKQALRNGANPEDVM